MKDMAKAPSEPFIGSGYNCENPTDLVVEDKAHRPKNLNYSCRGAKAKDQLVKLMAPVFWC